MQGTVETCEELTRNCKKFGTVSNIEELVKNI